MKTRMLLWALTLATVAGCGSNESNSGAGGASPAPGTSGSSKSPTSAATPSAKKWRIGFSQTTTTEPWRAVFNDQLKAEAAKHPEVELIIQDANDKTDLQVQQVRNLILRPTAFSPMK